MSSTWKIEHSLVTTAHRDLAWEYMSNMRNLAEMEGVRIELDGPFQTGTRGRTISADSTQEWELADVVPKERFVVTGKEGDFLLSFEWRFHDEGTGTKMTQQIYAQGPPPVMEQWAVVLRQMEESTPASMQSLATRLNELTNAD